jgi:DNA-binding CsgD family transcriptional regulator
VVWQTPLARDLLHRYFGGLDPQAPILQDAPDTVTQWLRRQVDLLNGAVFMPGTTEPPRMVVEQGARRLTFRLHEQAGDSEGGGDWLLVMRESSDVAAIDAMSLSFKLTAREAEVLYWVVKGKINRDIADILGASPATIKKHLERVFAKLGVETRTAAAGMAMNRLRALNPQFDA